MPLLQTTTAEGALKGMVTARAPHELQDQEVAYLQDAILHQPGFVSRRGAITGTTAITASNIDSERPYAVCSVVDPGGVTKIGIVYMKPVGGTSYEFWLAVFDKTFTFIQKHFITATSFFANNSTVYPTRTFMVQCVPAIDGSVIISIRNRYDRLTNFAAVAPTAGMKVIRWYGGCSTTSMTSGAINVTLTATEGATAVTGTTTEIAKVSFPGTIIVGTGVVASVTSTTQVELRYPSAVTYAAFATPTTFVETLPVTRARGRVSCAAGVLAAITGYGTMFTEMWERAVVGAGAGDGMTIFDASSMKKLAEIANNTTIAAPSDTATGVPTTVFRSASMKHYLANAWQTSTTGQNFIRHLVAYGGYDPTPKSVRGSFWATYKGLMISFNALVSSASASDAGDTPLTSRAYLHGPRFPEIMDHSVADGDWFEVQSTKPGDPDGIAIQSGRDCVILCKTQETFALTGENPDDFSINKIADDGALSFESVTSWKGMPIWMGKTGIWMYGGTGDPINITENTLGTWWKDRVDAFDTPNINNVDSANYLLNQARCFVYKDYLFVNIQNTGGVNSIFTDNTERTDQYPMYLMIYLPTMAVTTLTNFNFQAFLQVGRLGYVILPQSGSTTHHWFPLDNLFEQGVATTDSILTCNSYSGVGPWFHMESRAYDVGDGLLKKNWKQLAIESKMTNTKRMLLATVAGLNNVSVVAALPFVGTGSFKAARVKFRTRDQYMRFRLYEDINNRPSTLVLGAWQWAFKAARRGAV